MYINNKILIGKNENTEAYLIPKMANRHDIITGASGSGKTITLKVLAESFSEAGVPVFLADVKGDLAGMCVAGEHNENIDKRIEDLKLENFNFKVTYYDSATNYGIQLADLIVNTFYNSYKDRNIVKKVLPNLKEKNFRISLFPGHKIKGRNKKIEYTNNEMCSCQ